MENFDSEIVTAIRNSTNMADKTAKKLSKIKAGDTILISDSGIEKSAIVERTTKTMVIVENVRYSRITGTRINGNYRQAIS